MEDFSTEHIRIRKSMDALKDMINTLNVFRDVYLNGGNLRYENGNIKCFGKKDKKYWWQMIQLLPSSYNQTRNVMMYYEVLANIYSKLSDNTYIAGIVNKYKNYFGKSRVVVIKSQLGQPIVAYSGDEVYWKIPKDLPKMTKLMIDGKALYIHRANFQIIDTALLD